jgi:hypothetical protein
MVMHIDCIRVATGAELRYFKLLRNATITFGLPNIIHVFGRRITAVAVGTIKALLEVYVSHDNMRRSVVIFEISVAGYTVTVGGKYVSGNNRSKQNRY